MKCRNLLLLCFAFLSVFFSSLFITPKVNAISPISVTYSSWSANDYVFPNCDSTCLSQYSYFTIFTDNTSDSNLYFITSSSPVTYLNFTFPWYNGNWSGNSNFIFSSIPFSFSTFQFRHTKSGNTYTFTLSDSLPSFGSVSPSGSLFITENGTYDVSSYSEAVVNVPAEVIQGDYHDDLVSINNSILICASVCLILYFFYCIYRMLLKGRI